MRYAVSKSLARASTTGSHPVRNVSETKKRFIGDPLQEEHVSRSPGKVPDNVLALPEIHTTQIFVTLWKDVTRQLCW